MTNAIDLKTFSNALQELGHAFGKEVDTEMALQYFKGLAGLDENQVTLLFKWAMECIETGFPRIATLRAHAEAKGWFKPNPGNAPRDPWVYVICPKCEGRFVVRRKQLEEDARGHRAYRCTNYPVWNCNMVFRADMILAGEEE